MADAVNVRASESRLDALRREAAERGEIAGAGGARIDGGPLPPVPGYYGQPLLKAPVWTWEVPLYFVVGGAAGAAAVVACVAAWTGAGGTLARDARVIAVAGAVISPFLLISDLGRPARFLYMLRVAKLQSAMSIGAWTLVVFQMAAVLSLAVALVGASAGGAGAVLGPAADAAAAAAGLVLATYTGVLLGATAIPVWAAHARVLPIHFGASSLGVAVATLELAGHREPGLNLLGLGAAIVVLATALHTERRRDRLSAPLRAGRSGRLVRAGDLLAGLVPVVLRSLAAGSTPLRLAAAVAAIAGSLCTRYGWIAAGRASAADPAAALGEPS